MSSGKFNRSFYQLSTGNGGGIARIRVQPETVGLTDGTVANAAPAGPATVPVSAKVSASTGSYGIKPRTITIGWPEGGAPADYSGDPVTVPVLTEAAFAAYTLGSAVTYLATVGEVIGRSPEQVR